MNRNNEIITNGLILIEQNMNKLDEDIKIELVTDEEELKSKGHDAPVVELYNDVVDTWISIKNLSFQELEREITHIKSTTKTWKLDIKRYKEQKEFLRESMNKSL